MKPTRLAAIALLLATALFAPFAAPAADVDASGAVPGRWTHDYAAAAALARAQNLPLLLDFTGSDWCIWCKRMDAQVFSSDAWAAVAPSFALAFIDFPSDASALPAGAIGRNRQLAQIHRVQGYPTFVLLAPDGTPLLKTGTDLDPDSFIATLRDALPDDLAFGKPNDAETADAPDDAEAEEPLTPADETAEEESDDDADIDPFDLPDGLEVTRPEPPTNVVAIIDIRTCAAVIEKYLPTSLLDRFPVAGALDILKDADPQARFTVLLDAAHLSPVLGVSLAFYDADAPDAFLAALSDAGWATDDTADLPPDAPQGLLALANADGTRLYVLRQDNTLYIDDSLPTILRNLELSADLPPLLPAEGEIVCQVRPALLNVLPGLDLAPFLGQFDAVTFGAYLENGDLHVQVHMETAPGSDIQALAAAYRPAPPEASCVLLPGALLTSVSGASTDALAVQRLGATLADTIGKLPGGPSDDDLQSSLRHFSVATSMAVFPPVADPENADVPATPSILYYAGTHDIRNVPDADLPLNPIPAPDAAQTYRDIPVSAYDLPLAAIKKDLSIQCPSTVEWLIARTIPDSVRVCVARLPKGLLFATGPDDLLHAAIDAALDASAPAPDQTPEFQAAFPYPDAPAIGTFHSDLGALLAAYFHGFDPAEAQRQLHPDICENSLPDFATAAPDAPALIDTFSYALAENSSVVRLNFALPALAEIWIGFFHWAQDMSIKADFSDSIVQAPWNGYANAYILSNATVCAVVVPELGRMTFLSTSLDAPNRLRFDASLAGALPTPDTPFFNIGGDWLWPVPQDAWPLLPGSNGADWPPPPALADAPDAWTVSSTNEGLTLTRTYPAPVSCTVNRSFNLPSAGSLLVVQNLIPNAADTEASDQPAIPLALWQVAQLPLPDSISFDVHPEDSAYPGGVHIIAGDATFADNGEHGLAYAPSEGCEVKFGADIASSLGAQGPGPQRLRLDMGGTVAPGADSIQCYVNHGLGYAELETLGHPDDTGSIFNFVAYRLLPATPAPDDVDDAEPLAEDTDNADAPANIDAPADADLPE